MKNLFQYMAGVLLAGLLLTACSADEFDGANGQLPSVNDYADNFSVTVDQTTNTATFEFKESKGVTPYWVLDGTLVSSNAKFTQYWRKKGDHSVECRVMNSNGISDGSIVKTFTIEKTKMNGFGGFDEENNNLFRGAAMGDITTWFADAGWAMLDQQPTWTQADGATNVRWHGVGPSRWQGQFTFNNTGVSTQSGKQYDFSVILTSTKLHGGFKIKLCQQDNDDLILMDKDYKVTEADEPKCFFATELEGQDISNMKVVLDFGGGEEDTEVILESFVLVDHSLNQIEAPEELAEEFDYNDPGNLWKPVDDEQAFEESCWFGDAGWGDMGVKVADFKAVHSGATHTITIPATTVADQWHAQYGWNLTKGIELPFSADDAIDFSLRVKTSAKLPGMTVKLTQADNDDNFFCADRVEIKPGEYVFRYEGAKLSGGTDAPNMKFVFDFAGAEQGTEITISNVTIIKH